MPASDTLINDYLDELTHQRRQSQHTVYGYRRDLLVLSDFAAELMPPVPINSLQTTHLRRFISQLHARGLNGRSLARMLSAWRGFYRWLGQKGKATINPADGIRAPKARQALPKVLSPDEVNRLLDSPQDTLLDIRDQAIFELFYSSGLRLAELAQLDIDCLCDLDEGEIRVLGKRNKLRIVPVGEHACKSIGAWIKRRGEMALPGEKALFVGRRGSRIHPRVIEDRLKKKAMQQGLPVNVHPHMLRHSFASHVLQSSGDLRAVQEMLGHASIASTQVYTHLNFQHLAKIYDAAHPRAKRK